MVILGLMIIIKIVKLNYKVCPCIMFINKVVLDQREKFIFTIDSLLLNR